jgi:hypothetical protein
MPRARPETTTAPASPSPCASWRAKRQAAADALRAPTIATVVRDSRWRWPLTIKRWRRRLQLRKQRRVFGRAEEQIFGAEAVHALDFLFDLPRLAMRGARPPPRAARSGMAESARSAEPKRAMSWK